MDFMTRSGRTVLITGASSGIGLASAHQLLDRGWRVFAAARRLEKMEPLRQRGAEVLPLDIASEASRRQLADAISSRVGVLDALVNNAGFGDVGPVETMALNQARQMFEVNLFGLIGLTQLMLPRMRESSAPGASSMCHPSPEGLSLLEQVGTAQASMHSKASAMR